MGYIDITPSPPPQTPHPFWWPDTRGWLTIAFIALTFFVLWVISFFPNNVKDNQLFTQLATGIVLTGLIGFVLSFYMGSSKQSQENATASNQVTSQLVERLPSAPTILPATTGGAPLDVRVTNPVDSPVHVEETTSGPV